MAHREHHGGKDQDEPQANSDRQKDQDREIFPQHLFHGMAPFMRGPARIELAAYASGLNLPLCPVNRSRAGLPAHGGGISELVCSGMRLCAAIGPKTGPLMPRRGKKRDSPLLPAGGAALEEGGDAL